MMEDYELGAAQPRHEERQAELDPIDALGERIDEEMRIVDDEPAGPREDNEMSPVFRRRWLMHRADEAARAAQAKLARSWPQDRVPERVWRELGDKALGTESPKPQPTALERVIADWDEEERIINEHPEPQRHELRRWFASFHLLGDFMDSMAYQRQQWLDAERKRWDEAYLRRAIDESFGKKPWTGPSCREGARG